MSRVTSFPRKIAALAATMLFAGALFATDALAQDIFDDFFGGLFGGGGHHYAPRPGGYPRGDGGRMRRLSPVRQSKPKPARSTARPPQPSRPSGETVGAPSGGRGGSSPAPAETGQAAAPARAEPTFFVATVGDTLALQLANGLEEAFEDKPEIAILRKGKESSGLVRDDFYDWPKAAREIAADARKSDLAVIMLGSNDRQSVHESGGSHEPLSPKWREIYAARVDALLAAFKEKGVPVIWVGLPVMKNERFSADIEEINEIYRERASRAGAAFVDLWDSFSDENGRYRAFGPDINGEIVKIRAGDGVHFSSAGARSLANFVEGEIKRRFEERWPAAPIAAPTSPAPGAGAPDAGPSAAAVPGAQPKAPAAPIVFAPPGGAPPAPAPTLPDRPAIGPAQPLVAVPAVAADELARRAKPAAAADASGAAARAVLEHLYGEGGDQPPKPGRADDFSARAASEGGPSAPIPQ